MRTVTLEEFHSLLGQSLGTSPWLEVSQRMIDRFAAITGDDDFIHTAPERARDTRLGGTVAQGFLSLSLLPRLFRASDPQYPSGVTLRLNYGCNRVRFVSPVKSGARVRGHFRLAALADEQPGQLRATIGCTVEIENGAKPALVAEWLLRFFL